MNARTKQGKKTLPLPLAPMKDPDRYGDQRCSAWIVYHHAIEGGWGSTCRLCLVLAVRWGVPVTGGLKVVTLLLNHVH